MRAQTTLRLSEAETETIDSAAHRLHLDRAAFIRSAALGLAELVLAETRPLVLAVEPSEMLRRAADRLAGGSARGRAAR
jgi:uncharacterized protein (DUF1778 family)